MGHPSKQDFMKMIRGGTLMNCDVTEEDVKRMYDIWIVDVNALKGKSVRKTQIELDQVSLHYQQQS